MPDDPILRAKARASVEKGSLPSRLPDRLWGGPGDGAECAICDLPVVEMVFEMEFEHGGGMAMLRVHARCFAAWEFERERAHR